MPNTIKRRIDVMISSTTKDLAAHRKQARDAVQRLTWTPRAMELDEAEGHADPLTYSLRLVEEVDVYLGIFGVRYGFEPDDPARNPDSLSMTELEYRAAKARGIPMLIFLSTDDHVFPAEVTNDEDDAKRAKLKRFRDELGKEHTVSFFDSPEDLRFKAVVSLVNLMQSGALDADEDDETIDDDPDDDLLPPPPEFYAAPPYTLVTHFVGRTPELNRLDAWANSADSMMLVEAIGGMGKSAVTWEWVQTRAETVLALDGVMWWSFYERGATMSAFVRHALAYLTQQPPDALKNNPLKDNVQQLLRELRRGRYLLVLDGLERVLVAYHRWDAAQMRDDTIDEADPIIKERKIRECTDPKDAQILRLLMTCAPSKVLISSRLTPLPLETHGGNIANGVQHIELGGLHPDDALALVRSEGVSVRDERHFKQFMAKFGYHSLLVQLVAGRINRPGQARGNFDAWYERKGRHLSVADYDMKQQQTHILRYAFEGLTDTERRFLSQIAAFDDAVTYETLTVFNPFAKSAPEPVQEPYPWSGDEVKERYEIYLKEQEDYNTYRNSPEYSQALAQFDDLLHDLEQRGLLRWNRHDSTYDMHPVVRGYAFAMLEGETKVQTFEQIRHYFEQQPDDDIDAAEEVADLSNTIGVYRALLGAGKPDEAARFYNRRLKEFLHYNLAAYYTIVELLTPLFPDGTGQLPRLRDPSDQSKIITTLGSIFSYIGRNDEALTLNVLLIKLDLDNANLPYVIIDLRNYASSLDNDNQLALSQTARERALHLAEAIENQQHISRSYLFLLGSYKDTGQWQAADEAYAYLQANPPEQTYWQAEFEGYYAETLIYRGDDATAALNRAEDLAQRGNNALIYRQIQGWRGEVALQAGDYETAIRYFEECIRLERRAGAASVTVPLGGLARAYAHMGDRAKARELIEGGVNSIDTAEVYHLLGEHDSAREYAIRAYKYAWADGLPFVRWWTLERAKAVLDALEEPCPALSPCDPANIGKLPYDDEIQAVIERERRKRQSSGDDA